MLAAALRIHAQELGWWHPDVTVKVDVWYEA